ncbi:hypothetical protein QFZ43_008915 [Streptomyces afghaniensis]|nr:hypothetical protein [Streptomyces afghaniensis]
MNVGAGQAHTPEILGRDREMARIAQLIHAADNGRCAAPAKSAAFATPTSVALDASLLG